MSVGTYPIGNGEFFCPSLSSDACYTITCTTDEIGSGSGEMGSGSGELGSGSGFGSGDLIGSDGVGSGSGSGDVGSGSEASPSPFCAPSAQFLPAVPAGFVCSRGDLNSAHGNTEATPAARGFRTIARTSQTTSRPCQSLRALARKASGRACAVAVAIWALASALRPHDFSLPRPQVMAAIGGASTSVRLNAALPTAHGERIRAASSHCTPRLRQNSSAVSSKRPCSAGAAPSAVTWAPVTRAADLASLAQGRARGLVT
jgi:hypothetical protein